MAGQWYVKIMGSVVGPLEAADLQQMAKQGRITPDDPVRKGDGPWRQAHQVRGLFDAAPATPGTAKPPIRQPVPVAAATEAATPAVPAEPAKPQATPKQMATGCVGCFGMVVIMAMIGNCISDGGPSGGGGGSGGSGSANISSAEPAPPFEQIRNTMLAQTDAQWNRYSETLVGKRVAWTGWVEEVNERVFGGYDLWVDMDSPGQVVSVQDVTLSVSEGIALQLQKDQRVHVVGIIDSVSNILGSCQINLEDGATVQIVK